MFVGHIGVGLALKKVEPKLNLGTLLFASLFLDFLFGMFVLAGWEQIIVPENYAQLHYLNFSFPYSHSLAAGIVWSLVVFGVTYMIWRGEKHSRFSASLTLSGAVLIHWICDWIVHPPQLPIAGINSNQVGLGLWNHLQIALTLEATLMVVGMVLYLNAVKETNQKGRWVILGFISVIGLFALIGQAKVTLVPDVTTIAGSMIVQVLVVCGIVAWFDRDRDREIDK